MRYVERDRVFLLRGKVCVQMGKVMRDAFSHQFSLVNIRSMRGCQLLSCSNCDFSTYTDAAWCCASLVQSLELRTVFYLSC